MTHSTNDSDDLNKKLTRSKFLRNSALAASGAIFLPSFIAGLAGCQKIHDWGNGPANGWTGGFPQSNPAFAYPNPDLSSLPLLDNMDNINLLDRQQKVLWPEFSWETQKGAPDPKRCFRMFAPDISRIGYTNTGRVYSIICPQQGICYPGFGCMNVEVTVTGQRGWVDEPARTLAADLTIEPKIWFTPLALKSPRIKALWDAFKSKNLPFPSSKARAIKVTAYKYQDPNQPVFPVRTGQTKLFKSPDFAIHPEAYTVGNIEVEIGPIKKTNNALVDEFNQFVMDIFNLAAGNMLQAGNLLSWNVWFNTPEVVDRAEWKKHAIKWRDSIDADHGSPGPGGTNARYFDGSPFNPIDELILEKIKELFIWIYNHL